VSDTVSIHNRHRCIRPAHEPLRRLLQCIFRRERRRGSIALILTTTQHIRSLNRQYRQKETTTDVLSFPFGGDGEPDETGYWGEIYINLDYLSRQARTHRRRLRDEIALRVTHGMLHLFGYDHHRDSQAVQMNARECRLLTAAGFEVPPWEASPT
jgi:probable rRNA maturation factor